MAVEWCGGCLRHRRRKREHRLRRRDNSSVHLSNASPTRRHRWGIERAEYEVHNIGVNWPHHIFVNKDFKVVGAE